MRVKGGYYTSPHALKMWNTAYVDGLGMGVIAGILGFIGEFTRGIWALWSLPNRWAYKYGLTGAFVGLLYAPLCLVSRT